MFKLHLQLKYLIVAIILFITINVSAQSDKKLIKEAKRNFQNEEYNKALPEFLSLVEKDPSNSEFNFNLGICYLNSRAEKEKAIPYFEKAVKDSTSQEEYIYANYYLGQAYHFEYKFDDAIKAFENAKNHISLLEEDGVELKNDINRRIEMCNNGKKLIANPVNVVINNLGNSVNSPYPEYAPVISADESMLIFTSKRPYNVGGRTDENGEYYEDIYISKNVNWQWSKPISIDSSAYANQDSTQNLANSKTIKKNEVPINTKYHDAAIGLSPNGQKLFIYKFGKIYVSTLDGDVWTKPVKLNNNINYKRSRQPSISITSDGNTIYFSSDRKGGYGGLDIYKSQKMPDGEWGPAKNLGPEINTPYDDDAPFIHPDGKTLFFSSKGHNSMGGFDIFKSNYKDGKWSKPENLGYPINTTGDDIYYVESAKGDHAYLSSIREGGLGDMDIYLLLFPGVSLPVAEIKGKILAGDTLKPVAASINVTDKTTKKEVLYTSNSVTGEYLMFLPPNRQYKLTIKAEGYKTHTEEITIPDQKTFYELYQEIHITPVKVNKKAIGQEVTTQNVFFDVNKVIHSDSVLSKEYNRNLDSISKININQSKGTIASKSDSNKKNNEKEALYSKYINETQKVTTNNSNLSETQTLATKGTDTNSYKQISKIDYYEKPDSIAKIMNVSENTVSSLLNRPHDEALSIMNLPAKSIDKLSSLSDSSAQFLMKLPTSSITRILELPKNVVDTLCNIPLNTLQSILQLTDDNLIKVCELSKKKIVILSNMPLKTENTLLKLPVKSLSMVLELSLAQTKNKLLFDSLINMLNENKDVSDLLAVIDSIVNPKVSKPVAVMNGSNFSNVYFKFDEYRITDDSKILLDSISNYLIKNPDISLLISGNADSTGIKVLNYYLSTYRALAVRDYFLSKGIWLSRFRIKSFGDTKPVATNGSEEGRKLNRRVELSLIK